MASYDLEDVTTAAELVRLCLDEDEDSVPDHSSSARFAELVSAQAVLASAALSRYAAVLDLTYEEMLQEFALSCAVEEDAVRPELQQVSRDLSALLAAASDHALLGTVAGTVGAHTPIALAFSTVQLLENLQELTFADPTEVLSDLVWDARLAA